MPKAPPPRQNKSHRRGPSVLRVQKMARLGFKSPVQVLSKSHVALLLANLTLFGVWLGIGVHLRLADLQQRQVSEVNTQYYTNTMSTMLA